MQKISKYIDEKGIPEYTFDDYCKPEDFFRVTKLIQKIKGLKLRVVEKIDAESYLMWIYSFKGGEIYLINTNFDGNYMTIKNKEFESLLDEVIEHIRCL